MDKNTGVGLGGLLTIAFVVLKLTKVIAWSWWWVLAPIWAPFCLFMLWFFVQLIVLAVRYSRQSKRR